MGKKEDQIKEVSKKKVSAVKNTKNKSDTGTKTRGLMSLKTDIVFKRVFGLESHKRVLVCLLNAILNGKPYIKSVEFDKTELVSDREDGKTVRLDIAATTDSGVSINIEMQCKNTLDNIIDRADFYDAKRQKESIDRGESYSSIPDRILIWITDFNATPRKCCVNEVVQMYKANDLEPVEIASEKMRKFIIELTKIEMIPKSYVSDMFAIWMQFIKDPESIPPEFLKIPEVREAMEELQFVSQDKKLRAEYEARLKEISDFNAGIANARKEEREKAEKEKKQLVEKAKAEKKQLEEKAKAEKIESAKNLLKAGISVEIVANSLGFSPEEVRKL